MKGDELTADAKLLESGVELNKADLTRMFDAAKAVNNHTMMELAWRRSLKDGIVIERPYFSEKDLNDAADMMERYANSALSDSAYFGIWSAPGKLATITPAALKTAQEAAQRAGETVPAFVGRAIETQAQRDKVIQAMKPKEKAPDKSET